MSSWTEYSTRRRAAAGAEPSANRREHVRAADVGEDAAAARRHAGARCARGRRARPSAARRVAPRRPRRRRAASADRTAIVWRRARTASPACSSPRIRSRDRERDREVGRVGRGTARPSPRLAPAAPTRAARRSRRSRRPTSSDVAIRARSAWRDTVARATARSKRSQGAEPPDDAASDRRSMVTVDVRGSPVPTAVTAAAGNAAVGGGSLARRRRSRRGDDQEDEVREKLYAQARSRAHRSGGRAGAPARASSRRMSPTGPPP